MLMALIICKYFGKTWNQWKEKGYIDEDNRKIYCDK